MKQEIMSNESWYVDDIPRVQFMTTSHLVGKHFC